MADETKAYECENCECGRSLQVERKEDGDYLLTLVDPEIEFDEWINTDALRERLVEAEEDAFMVFASNGIDEGGMFLSDAQIADLRAWVDIAPPAKPVTADQVRAMFAAMDKAAETRGGR
jgi:hypothetical protein